MLTILQKFLSRPKRPPECPSGMRVYAVGDIHGCLSELEELLDLIASDCRGYSGVPLLLFLGDYVDRGPDSAGVLRRLTSKPLPTVQHRFLAGNHDSAMLGCYDSGRGLTQWLSYGGASTLRSYGFLEFDLNQPREKIIARMRQVIPDRDMTFLRHLKRSFRLGDYFFAHAGIRPGVPLKEQKDSDLQWIRQGFLDSNARHEAVVVHGHTVSPEPDIRHNRIGIDTGCFKTGRLTALVLQGSEQRVLHTGSAETHRPWYD